MSRASLPFRIRRSLTTLPFRIRRPLRRVKQQNNTASQFLVRQQGPPDYLKLALTSSVYDYLSETRLDFARGVSERLGSSVHLKREDTNPAFTYYLRGAYNQLAAAKRNGQDSVVTGSVGSRGYAVAHVARLLGLHASVVMPTSTPEARVETVRREGASVISHGENVAEAQAEAQRLADTKGASLLDAHNDPLVIAGHATAGLEVLRQHSMSLAALRRSGEGSVPAGAAELGRLDGIFVNVGGGSLLSGVTAVVKALSPDTLVIGVEPEGVDVLQRSLMAGKCVTIADPGVDGVWVRHLGSEVFRLCDELVDDVVTVTNAEIGNAMGECFKDTRAMLEPAGAVSLAGLSKWLERGGAPGNYVAITSDAANIEFEFMEWVAGQGIVLRKF